MKNIVLIITILVGLGFLSSLVVFFYKYPERFSFFGNDSAASIQLKKYKILTATQHSEQYITPVLPDISGYNLRTLKDKIPALSSGGISIQKLEEGYSVLRSQTAQYGDMQSRLDPLSIVITSGVVSLENVTKEINDTSLIEQNGAGAFMLHVPLVVREKGVLIIEEGQTLLMNANTGVMLPVYGQLHVIKAHILGWDVAQDQPAEYKNSKDFRPYITAWCGSEVNIGGSYLGYLGYKAPKAYGLTYSSCENNKYVAPGTMLKSGTGWVIDNEFEQLYFGFYSHETENAVIVNNKYKDNIVYGIDPHDFSKNLIIASNKVQGVKEKHGIIISRGVSDSFIFNNHVESNKGSGIMIDRNSTKNIIAYNTSINNQGDGIAFYESPHNVSYKNSYSGNMGAGLRVRNSWDVLSYQDIVNDNGQYGAEIYTETLENRDIAKDAYSKRAALDIVQSEIIANKSGVFKFSDFDQVMLDNAKIYEIERSVFAGELQSLPNNVINQHKVLKIQQR